MGGFLVVAHDKLAAITLRTRKDAVWSRFTGNHALQLSTFRSREVIKFADASDLGHGREAGTPVTGLLQWPLMLSVAGIPARDAALQCHVNQQNTFLRAHKTVKLRCLGKPSHWQLSLGGVSSSSSRAPVSAPRLGRACASRRALSPRLMGTELPQIVEESPISAASSERRSAAAGIGAVVAAAAWALTRPQAAVPGLFLPFASASSASTFGWTQQLGARVEREE